MITITVTRKPLSEPTVALNVLTHGTGAINVDGCRVEGTVQGQSARAGEVYGADQRDQRVFEPHGGGRWPANLIHDGSDEVVRLFPYSSVTGKRTGKSKSATVHGTNWLSDNHESTEYTDSGSAARFFYCVNVNKTGSSGRKP